MTQGGTALVTGASSGIGDAYARALAGLGHGLVLVARRADRLEALAAEIDGPVEVLVADLTDPADLARVGERAGRDDVTLLVNNAGLNGYAAFAEVDPATLAAVNALNVIAPVTLTRAALPAMIRRGSGAVVNVASLLAFSAQVRAPFLPERVVYAAGKAYLVAFTRLLAGELAGTGVTAQVLCPGLVTTEFHDVSGAPDMPAMSAADVVRASLAALSDGELVCCPGLTDPGPVGALADAEQALLFASGGPELAARYAAAPVN